MGAFFTCCLEDSNVDTPDPETRRQQMAEAAEKRQKQSDQRGLKDPEGFKQKQKKKEELEKRQQEADAVGGEGGLKWQVG